MTDDYPAQWRYTALEATVKDGKLVVDVKCAADDRTYTHVYDAEAAGVILAAIAEETVGAEVDGDA